MLAYGWVSTSHVAARGPTVGPVPVARVGQKSRGQGQAKPHEAETVVWAERGSGIVEGPHIPVAMAVCCPGLII